MELSDILKKRRSSRHYLKKPVPKELLEDLVSSAINAPVSCNLQVTQYLIIDDPVVLDKLTKEVSYKFAYAPAYFLILYDPRFTVERDSIISSSAMSAENIVLRATDLELSTCPMAGFDKDHKIRKILDIPEYIEILLMISVGFTDPYFEPMPPFRVDHERSFSFNNYGKMRTLNSSGFLSDHSIGDIIDYRSRISTVYLDRFRLNTYRESYYDMAYKFFFENIKNINIKKVIDILSYDGVFLKLLSNNKNFSLTASDYLKKNLDFFQKTLNCSIVSIDSSNKIDIKEKYDCVTLVFQAEFTPNLEALIHSVSNILNKDGVLFIATSTDDWHKRVVKFILKQYRRFILKKLNNIYEGNVFYKIGPRVHLSNSDIESLSHKFNLSVIKKEVVNVGRGSNLNFFILTKASL